MPFEYPDGKKASVICVDLPESVAAQYRVDERYGADDLGQGCEFLVPAAVVNAFAAERID